MEEYRLELRNVSKTFGEVKALENIDFQLGRNEVVGLLGDNGAGKSTLIKLLTGYYQPTSGEIYFNGQAVDHLTVPKARELGVETVYQERALAELQTLWRNIFLGRELVTRGGLLDVTKMRQETHRLMTQSMGFTSSAVNPESKVGTFSGGEKQGVAIVRALYFDAEIIILDEPTMGLSLKETAKLIHFVRDIKRAGKSAIFIDHNILHVYNVADRVVVIDRGRVAGQGGRRDRIARRHLGCEVIVDGEGRELVELGEDLGRGVGQAGLGGGRIVGGDGDRRGLVVGDGDRGRGGIDAHRGVAGGGEGDGDRLVALEQRIVDDAGDVDDRGLGAGGDRDDVLEGARQLDPQQVLVDVQPEPTSPEARDDPLGKLRVRRGDDRRGRRRHHRRGQVGHPERAGEEGRRGPGGHRPDGQGVRAARRQLHPLR